MTSSWGLGENCSRCICVEDDTCVNSLSFLNLKRSGSDVADEGLGGCGPAEPRPISPRLSVCGRTLSPEPGPSFLYVISGEASRNFGFLGREVLRFRKG